MQGVFGHNLTSKCSRAQQSWAADARRYVLKVQTS